MNLKNLPDSPGVYLMKDCAGRIIYIGKAVNLKRRVMSYFLRAHDLRVEQLVNGIRKIDYKKTDSALEALILESKLIKQYSPKFNVKEKDDKSFFYLEITKEKFPRVLLVRGKDVTSHQLKVKSQFYGPFTSASNIREALKILRRIFPWSVHEVTSNKGQVTKTRHTRPCFDYEIGLCPGTCIGAIEKKEYVKNIKRLKLILVGKKNQIVKSLQKEMRTESKALEFEKAERLRRQIFALKHIRDTALVSDGEIRNWKLPARRSLGAGGEIENSAQRIEGYDISNISGDSAVGSMVVFEGEKPNKNEYRKFRIRSLSRPHDAGMIKEILRRRFRHAPPAGGWPLPNVILVDGGRGQVNAARAILRKVELKIPVVGIAKGPERKKNEFIGIIPRGVDAKTLIKVRDEAHRFAIKYHKELRGRNFLKS